MDLRTPGWKFTLTESNLKAVRCIRNPDREFKITDTYYDTEKLDMAQIDQRLRYRISLDTGWQMKIPNGQGGHVRVSDIDKIRSAFGLTELCINSLRDAGYMKIMDIVSERATYLTEDFIIRTYSVDQKDLRYAVGEIVPRVMGQVLATDDRVMSFAGKHGIVVDEPRGIFAEYIRINRPDDFLVIKTIGTFK